jgi:hypothetical protein
MHDPSLAAPIVVQHHTQTEVIRIEEHATEQHAPTVQQERVADDVFSKAQHAAAALLAMQTGVGLLHTIALEAAPAPEEKPAPPRRKRLDRPASE